MWRATIAALVSILYKLLFSKLVHTMTKNFDVLLLNFCVLNRKLPFKSVAKKNGIESTAVCIEWCKNNDHAMITCCHRAVACDGYVIITRR